MGPIPAEISIVPLSQDSRGSARRTLRLGVSLSSSQLWTKALIHNLSETGLMIETSAELATGETIRFDLPVAGPAEARIVWNRESYYGCEFLTPLAKAAVSAALLQTPVSDTDSAMAPLVEEVPVGMSPSVEDIEAWKAEFDKTRGKTGHQLLGFRQTSDGLLIAMITKAH